MLASIDHRFVLICNPKAGSTALEKAYRQYANFDVGRGNRWKHLTWLEYREIFGDYFERHGCDVVAVVRDPVELLLSWWRFRQRPKIQDPAHPHHGNSTVGIDFAAWVEEWASDDPPPRARLIEQIDVLSESDGRPAPINFVRYELIDQLVAVLNDRIGDDVELTTANASPRIDVVPDRAWIESLPAMQRHLDFYRAALARGARLDGRHI